jgi:aminodeoxyfutalosine deaminase
VITRNFNSFVKKQVLPLMRYLTADCILPVATDPLYAHALALSDDGSIAGILPLRDLAAQGITPETFDGILCPGFVNTHCHLELSWAKGRIEPGRGLDHFVRSLQELRQTLSAEDSRAAIRQEGRAMERSGTVALADIANTDHTLAYKTGSDLFSHTFVEVFGSDPVRAEQILGRARELRESFVNAGHRNTSSVSPHSTYSVSEALFRGIAGQGTDTLLSLHHQENSDENDYFRDGSGPIAERRIAFNPGLPPFPGTGKTPLQSIAGYFGPDQKLLLVHNTVSREADVLFANHTFSNAYWCLCPNANLYIEKRLPNLRMMHRNGCRFTLGTDSLASNRGLNLLFEIQTLQGHFPEIPLPELIRWGTLNGASFLGLEAVLGSFEAGKSPGVVLIENADATHLRLNENSTSRLLIPAGK